jgi:hypothetical protein
MSTQKLQADLTTAYNSDPNHYRGFHGWRDISHSAADESKNGQIIESSQIIGSFINNQSGLAIQPGYVYTYTPAETLSILKADIHEKRNRGITDRDISLLEGAYLEVFELNLSDEVRNELRVSWNMYQKDKGVAKWEASKVKAATGEAPPTPVTQ